MCAPILGCRLAESRTVATEGRSRCSAYASFATSRRSWSKNSSVLRLAAEARVRIAAVDASLVGRETAYMAKKHTAQCACGAIKFEFNTDPTFIAVCHCLDCKKSSGGEAATFFGVP